jgi:hypothetical protein
MDEYRLHSANLDARHPYALSLVVLRNDTPSTQPPHLAPSLAPKEATIRRAGVSTLSSETLFDMKSSQLVFQDHSKSNAGGHADIA